MTTVVTKVADVLGLQKAASHGLEKLSVPTCDGNRKSYATWKSRNLNVGCISTNRTKANSCEN